jgi:hypothetical protein
MTRPQWDISNEGRSGNKDECWQPFELIPEKFEMISGQLALSDEERENLFCVLLELIGTDRAVQFGDPNVWRGAVEKLPA